MDMFNRKLVKSLRAELEEIALKNPLAREVNCQKYKIEELESDIKKLLSPQECKSLTTNHYYLHNRMYHSASPIELSGDTVTLSNSRTYVRTRDGHWWDFNVLKPYPKEGLRERKYGYRLIDYQIRASIIEEVNKVGGTVVSYTFDRGDTVEAEYVFKTKQELLDSL